MHGPGRVYMKQVMCKTLTIRWMNFAFPVALAAGLVFHACNDNPTDATCLLVHHEAYVDSLVYAYVHLPAGTVVASGSESGGNTLLPYPGNWAGISLGGRELPEGQKVNALVLGQPLSTGSVLQVRLIALFEMSNGNRPERILIAVPTDSTLQSTNITHFYDLLTEQEPARNILQSWLLNFSHAETRQLIGWRDEEQAMRYLRTMYNQSED